MAPVRSKRRRQERGSWPTSNSIRANSSRLLRDTSLIFSLASPIFKNFKLGSHLTPRPNKGARVLTHHFHFTHSANGLLKQLSRTCASSSGLPRLPLGLCYLPNPKPACVRVCVWNVMSACVCVRGRDQTTHLPLMRSLVFKARLCDVTPDSLCV